MIKFDELLVNFFETLKKGFLTWIAWMKKVEELKDLGCSVRGRFYDLAWSKPVLRAPAVHGVSSTAFEVWGIFIAPEALLME